MKKNLSRFLVLCIAGVFGMCAAVDASSTPLPSGTQANITGSFSILIEKGGAWKEVAVSPCDKSFSEWVVDLGTYLSSPDAVALRIVQTRGETAHLDALSLGGKPPDAVTGSDDAQALAKVSRKDFDVLDVTGKTMEFHFTGGRGDAVLKLTARIEPEKLSRVPFQFPTANLFKSADKISQFYTYRLNDAAMAGPGDPLFKEFCIPGSGHPAGYTYGWVWNDNGFLYVNIDFTPDNTMDGNKDYAKVFIKTDKGPREFTVSRDESRWGSQDFTYTDKAVYQHMRYSFKIPLTEVNAEDGTVKLAFAAYGTATVVMPDYPDVATDSKGNKHIVYTTSGGGNGFVDGYGGYGGLWYEMRGPDDSTIIYPIVINNNDGSDATHPTVAVDSKDRVFVVWERQFEGSADIYICRLEPALFNPEERVSPLVIKTLNDRSITLPDSDDVLEVTPQIVIDKTVSPNRVHVVWEKTYPMVGISIEQKGSSEGSIMYTRLNPETGAQIVKERSVNIPYDGPHSYFYESLPDCAVGVNHNVHVAWNEEVPSLAPADYVEGTEVGGGVSEIFYALLNGATGKDIIPATQMTGCPGGPTLKTPVNGNGNADCYTNSDSQSISVDTSGRAYIIWEDDRYSFPMRSGPSRGWIRWGKFLSPSSRN
ncbi:MAG: hypothetical protein NT072_04920 [Deltaproteobacteria bacterium]|nr:hypothetical protein [Deltaproteobacteria bacterium]